MSDELPSDADVTLDEFERAVVLAVADAAPAPTAAALHAHATGATVTNGTRLTVNYVLKLSNGT